MQEHKWGKEDLRSVAVGLESARSRRPKSNLDGGGKRTKDTAGREMEDEVRPSSRRSDWQLSPTMTRFREEKKSVSLEFIAEEDFQEENSKVRRKRLINPISRKNSARLAPVRKKEGSARG